MHAHVHVQVVRHVLARHDPSRCAESAPAKRTQRQSREGHNDDRDQRAVRFRGNELLGLVTVGGAEVGSVTVTPTTITFDLFVDSFFAVVSRRERQATKVESCCPVM